MKKLLSMILLAAFTCQVDAREVKVTSPDGKIVVTVNDDAGQIQYQVELNNKVFIEKSKLGLVTDLGDYTQGLALADKESIKEITDHYELPNIKQSSVDYKANELVFGCLQNGNQVFDVQFRVSNRDVAFRYKVYPVKDKNSGVIKQEASSFKLPASTTTFLCPGRANAWICWYITKLRNIVYP